jgi:MFS family permease
MEANASSDRQDDMDVGRLLRALSLPTFGLALAMSVLTTYAPVLLGRTTASGTAIGVAVGGEGLFTLFLPLVIGSVSDRTPMTRLGRRLPYAVFAAPLLVLPLAVLPFAHSYAVAVGLISLFFVGYSVYYPPYQALFAELVPASHHGRAQGAQGVMRGLGLGGALLVGGALLSIWAPLPFLLAGAAIVVTTVLLVWEVREPSIRVAPPRLERGEAGPGVLTLLRERPPLRSFVVANALWELSFMGLKTFIVLYLVKGLGQSTATASAVIGVVAAAYVLASWGAGRLADRVGIVRLLRAAIWVYGAGLLVGAATTSMAPMLLGLPIVALAGAVLMTLPYGLLIRMTPAGSEGAVAGIFSFSRGAGAIFGPIVVGVAIDLLHPMFRATNGYGAMWIAIGVPILFSLAFLPGLGEDTATERVAAPIVADAELALSA